MLEKTEREIKNGQSRETLISPLVFSKVYSLQSVLCLVYTMLTVSLDCPFLISPLVFSKVYSLHNTICVGQHYTQTITNNIKKTWALQNRPSFSDLYWPWYIIYNQLMLLFIETVFLASASKSIILAMVDGIQRRRWLKNSPNPSGAYV
jgi:hypothetical protein